MPSWHHEQRGGENPLEIFPSILTLPAFKTHSDRKLARSDFVINELVWVCLGVAALAVTLGHGQNTYPPDGPNCGQSTLAQVQVQSSNKDGVSLLS